MSLIERIQHAINTDDDDQSERLAAVYAGADAAGKALLDDAFICLCGWSLHTLICETKEEQP